MAISHIDPTCLPTTLPSILPTSSAPSPAAPFAQIVDQLIGQANVNQIQANQAVSDLATGRLENIHDVTLAVAKADLSFRLVLEIRNRLIEAFQEVMRMQI